MIWVGVVFCFFAWTLLRFSDLWVEGHQFLWKIFKHDVLKYLFSVPQRSPRLLGSQLHIDGLTLPCSPAVTLCPSFPVAFLLVAHLGLFMWHFLQVH